MTTENPPPDGPRRLPHRVVDLRLQHERTTLSSDRTAVAMIVAGSVFLHAGKGPLHSPRHVPGVVAIAFRAMLLAHAYRRYERLRTSVATGTGSATPWLLRLVGVATLLFSLASLVLIVAGG